MNGFAGGRRCAIISAARAGDYWRARNLLANSWIWSWETTLGLTEEQIASIKALPAWRVEDAEVLEQPTYKKRKDEVTV